MTDWRVYRGDGVPGAVPLPAAPPWRRFDGEVLLERTIADATAHDAALFQTTPELVEAVNAALTLRRPLLLTGRPGSGKSTLIEAVARELVLGRVLRWHITSASTLTAALYRYDALGRLQERQLIARPARPAGTTGLRRTSVHRPALDISAYLRLGPLGTALLPTDRPRALLVDEIDKSDVDLPSDLLNVFERGEFEIPELARLGQRTVDVREDGGDERFPIVDGHVRCCEFPFVVLTSNGERDFPPAFLRRCVQFKMPDPTPPLLTRIVTAHLGDDVAAEAEDLIERFADRAGRSRAHATDQLLNAIFVLMGPAELTDDERARVTELLLRELESDAP
jgi:MoxR-like ATPase